MIQCKPDIAKVEKYNIKNESKLDNGLMLTEKEKQAYALMDTNYNIDIKVAKNRAKEIASFLDDKDSLKGNREISKMDIIGRKHNLDKDSIPRIYLFNFKDDKGYVLMSGDRRAPGILTIGEGGNLKEKDTLNPGLAMELDNSIRGLKAEIDRKNKLRDSLYPQVMEKLINKMFSKEDIKKIDDSLRIEYEKNDGKYSKKYYPGYYSYDPYDSYRYGYYASSLITRTYYIYDYKSSSKGPYIETNWDQGRPYNGYTPDRCGGRTPTGCVAVALAQIAAYWEHPKKYFYFKGGWPKFYSYDSKDFAYPWYKYPKHYHWFKYNWKEMKEGSSDYIWQIADLMRYIGHLVGMDYDCKASGANSYTATHTFGAYFNYIINYTSYVNQQILINEIDRSRPVYVGGCLSRADWWFFFTYWNCHAWVVDGYKRFYHQTTAVTYTYHYNNPPNYNPNLKCNDVYTSYNNRVTCSTYSYGYYSYLFHCNWGWSGKETYVRFSNFNSSKGSYKYNRRIATFKPY